MREIWTKLNKEVSRTNLPSSLYLVLLYVSTYAVALAQEPYHAQSSTSQNGSALVNSANHDIKVAGTILQLQTTHAGIHLLVNGPQGTIDAHLGSGLTVEMQQKLLKNEPVQITGFFQTTNGKQYFLARTVTIAGCTIPIRNNYGSPVYSRSATGQNRFNGGAQ